MPGVPFVILTLHSGMESETERCTRRNMAKENMRLERREEERKTELAVVCVCVCVCVGGGGVGRE